MQCGAVESSVVLHPSPHDRVDLSRKVGDGVPDPAVQPPSADLTAYLVLGVLADRRLERDEHLSVGRPRGTGTKGEPQERERGELTIESAFPVLAVHHC